jgi:tRNA threonylcarbamoyladenosine biosynthesis protein TsaE
MYSGPILSFSGWEVNKKRFFICGRMCYNVEELQNRSNAMEFFTHSEQETEDLGQRLGAQLRPGAVIAYHGDLGAGKTAFTRGLARGLGVTERVTSPTYNIVNEYPGRLPLFHFDMYRLGSSEDLFDIGWEDYLERGGVVAVEWSERVSDVLEDALHITISRDPAAENSRRIIIEGGTAYEAISL